MVEVLLPLLGGKLENLEFDRGIQWACRFVWFFLYRKMGDRAIGRETGPGGRPELVTKPDFPGAFEFGKVGGNGSLRMSETSLPRLRSQNQ